jgi:hypothetical protein
MSEELDSVKDEIKLILDISKTLQFQIEKIMDAPALNGGFDKLVRDIEILKDNQIDLKKSVKSMKESVYKPTEGLFSQLQDHGSKIKRLEEIEGNCPYNEIQSLVSWSRLADSQIVNNKENIDTVKTELKNSDEEFDKTVSDMILKIDRLETFKSGFLKSLWIILPLFTGMSGKLAYDLLIILVKNAQLISS